MRQHSVTAAQNCQLASRAIPFIHFMKKRLPMNSCWTHPLVVLSFSSPNIPPEGMFSSQVARDLRRRSSRDRVGSTNLEARSDGMGRDGKRSCENLDMEILE